jgi:hypothetical protein
MTVAVGAGMIVKTAFGPEFPAAGRKINRDPIHKVAVIKPRKMDATSIPDVNIVPDDFIFKLPMALRKTPDPK